MIDEKPMYLIAHKGDVEFRQGIGFEGKIEKIVKLNQNGEFHKKWKLSEFLHMQDDLKFILFSDAIMEHDKYLLDYVDAKNDEVR